MGTQPCGCDPTHVVKGIITPYLCEEHRKTQSSRTFYHTHYTLDVLSETPIPSDTDINVIVRRLVGEGNYVWRFVRQVTNPYNASEIVRLLQAFGEDESVFNLTPDGKDTNQ